MRPLRGVQETRVATREESGVLGFPSRRGLTPRGSLECNPEIPAFPGEENYKESACNAEDPSSIPGLGKSTREGIGYPLQYPWACGSAGKEPSCNVRDLDSIPGLGSTPGEGKGYPFQDSFLENSMDCIVHGVTKSQTRLSDFHFHFQLL